MASCMELIQISESNYDWVSDKYVIQLQQGSTFRRRIRAVTLCAGTVAVGMAYRWQSGEISWVLQSKWQISEHQQGQKLYQHTEAGAQLYNGERRFISK